MATSVRSRRPDVSGDVTRLLESLHDRHNRPDFIADDPISIPHHFAARDDREIAGFFAATISWGTRVSILNSARELIRRMDDSPARFVLGASPRELDTLRGFVHRTLNAEDLVDLVLAVRGLCHRFGGIGRFFESAYAETGSIPAALSRFRAELLAGSHHPHVEKHISSIDRGSACKRLNMYLRWFVRRDSHGVDFGLWRSIPPSALYLPLDTHTAAAGRALGLLTRRQNDWKAVEEITDRLRTIDPEDPVRFDYALFGWRPATSPIPNPR